MLRYQYLEKRPIVYVDESGFAVDRPRDRGYSLKGQRCYGIKNWHCRGSVNAIGAIMDFKVLTVCLFQTNINAEIFKRWLTQDLLPKLPEKSVIVLDNATFHKRKDILQAVQEQGHTLEFLPPYSPDLNPIENKWAQAKAIRRKIRCDPYQLFLYPGL